MSWIQSKDQASFNGGLNLIKDMCGTDGGLIVYFEKLSDDKASFAEYLLSTYEGNLTLKGSAIAEANNASVLSFIHDLTSARSLEELVNLLLKRQQFKETKTNNLLMNQYLTLQGEQRTSSGWQKSAASSLCLESY